MRITLSDPAYLSELVDDLLHGGCVPAAVDASTLELSYPDAEDARVARLELDFFLRAWGLGHPDIELTFS